MAAARGELPDFNLLAAFGLEEFRNEKDAMNAEKNEASGELSNIEHSNKNRRGDLRRWKSRTSTTSLQIRRLNERKKQHNGRSQFLQVS